MWRIKHIKYDEQDIKDAVNDLDNNKYDYFTRKEEGNDYYIISIKGNKYGPKRIFECICKNKKQPLPKFTDNPSLREHIKKAGFEVYKKHNNVIIKNKTELQKMIIIKKTKKSEIQNKINCEINNLINTVKDYLHKDNILNEFEEYKNERGYYTHRKGIYAIYLKDSQNFGNDFQKVNIQKTLKEKQEKTNEELKKTNAKKADLFYIGKTCDSFQNRVIGSGGHMQGGNTSVSRKLYSYLHDCEKKEYKNIKKKGKNEKNELAEWFEKNLEVKFYPVDDSEYSDIIITILENILIHMYQPPLNSDGCRDRV